MTGSSIRRCATLLLGAALAVSGLASPVQAGTDAPVVVIVMENHAYGATDPGVNGDPTKYVVGNTVDAPYLNGTLIPSGTLFTNDYAPYHPSLPNYLELTAGTNAGCTVDSCSRDSFPNENLFHLLGQAGASFASLQESMPANCTFTDSGLYAVRHNPEIYFTNLDAASGLAYACPNTDMTIAPGVTPGTVLAWPNPLPAFSFVTPNLCHDMHGSKPTGVCPNKTDQIIADGDAWLGANVPVLLAEGAIVIVTFDEGGSGDSTGGGGHIATIMTGLKVPVAIDATLYNHASLLAGLENYFGLTPLLADAATATPLPIPRTTPYATPTISGLTPETGAPGDAVTIAGTGLTNAYSVQFAGTPASFSADSDSSITASVPAGAMAGQVTVSTIGGTATSPDTFIPLPGSPAPALVQHAVGSGTKATQASATWPQTTAAGDLQVATIAWSGSAKVTPPSGWVLAISFGGTATYYRENAPAASGSSTFALSVKANWVLSVSEWSGIAILGSLDRTAHATSGTMNGMMASSGTTSVTSQPAELAIVGIKALASLTQSGPTNGFVQLDQRSAGANDTLGTYGLVSTAVGMQSTSISLSASAKWRGSIATFRGA